MTTPAHPTARARLLALALALSALAAACGGADDTAAAPATPTATATATATPTPTPTPTPTDEVKAPPPTVEAPEPTATPTPLPTETPLTAPDMAEPLTDAGDEMGVGGATTYDEYALISDDSGAIQVAVPTEWAQVDGRPFSDAQGRQLFDVRAAPDLEGFAQTWTVPGIIVTASTDVAQSANEVTLLDELVEPLSGQCTYLGRQPYDDGLYTGQLDVYDACGGTATGYVVVGAVPDSRAFVVRVQVQVVEERDLEALQQAIDSFVVTGDV